MRINTRFCFLVFSFTISLSPLEAAEYTVDSTNDEAGAGFQVCSAAASDCSLRGAVIKANGSVGVDDILVPASSIPYAITIPKGAEGDNAGALDATVGDIDITEAVRILGDGADQVRIEASGTGDRVFMFNVGSALPSEITGVTITGGHAGFRGGAIWAFNSGLALRESRITGNMAAADGGGVSVDSFSGSSSIFATTIDGNTAVQSGGGLFYETGQLIISNSTFSGNSVTGAGDGGALHAFTSSGSGIEIFSTTLVGNSVAAGNGGGVLEGALATVTIKNSVLANNMKGATTENCSGAVASGGGNVSNDASCAFGGSDDSVAGTIVNPTLTNNGGPMPTHILPTGSPAIDRGGDTCEVGPGSLSFDQRGFERVLDGDGDGVAKCDAGAVEVGCGNGVIEIDEECDDGNTTDGDGCTAVCTAPGGTTGDDTGGDDSGGGCSLVSFTSVSENRAAGSGLIRP